MCKKIAFITAGGQGDRMGSQVPKQFLLLQGIPVIVHTLLKFEKNPAIDIIIVACLKGWEDYLRNLAVEYKISKLVTIVTGGANSQESIQHGIDYLVCNNYSEDDIIIVHESVRPFITDRIITDNIDICQKRGNAVTAIRGNESYLYSENGEESEKPYLRESMYMVQTPQTFRMGLLIKALNKTKETNKVFQSLFLMVSDIYHIPLNIVTGDRFNIKLTYPEDLKILEMLLDLNLKK